MPKSLDVYGDSDSAGDEERKRSTTGVAEILGGHLLDAVSVTQSLVALSSAEAEFYACNRGTAGGLHTCHFLTEAGYKVVPCGATAVPAVGLSAEQAQAGSGTWRSDTCGHRSGCRKGSSPLKAVPTNDNVADLMTKHLAAARVEELLAKLGVRRCTRGACGRILDYGSRGERL